MSEFEPVARRSTPEIIADQLRERILDGTLAPGSQLGEAALARRMEVSRGPIREAMQRLIQEGLLENIRHRGVFVIRLGPEDIDDIYSARNFVERAAAEALMERHDRDALDSLESLLPQMERAADAKDWPRLSDLDLRFHEEIVMASGSTRLGRMFHTLIAETRMCLAALEPAYPRPSELVDEHRAMFEALAAGRRDEALERIDAHMARARRKLAANPPAHPAEATSTRR